MRADDDRICSKNGYIRVLDISLGTPVEMT